MKIFGLPLLIIAYGLNANLLFAKPKTIENRQPLSFLENKGQIKDQNFSPRADIDFLVKADGFSVFIGSGHMHYQFSKRVICQEFDSSLSKLKMKNSNIKIDKNILLTSEVETYRIDVDLEGSRKDIKPLTIEPQKYYENYFINNPAATEIQAHTYNRIVYKNIYPNIDWVLYIKNNQLEYEFVLNTPADVSQINIIYNGQSSIYINETGSLKIESPLGTVTERAPVCYNSKGTIITSKYQLANDKLQFKTGSYDGWLTIDPVLEWGTYYGFDSSSTLNYSVVCDDSGQIYTCGMTYSASSGTIATAGAFQNVYNGNADGFIAKFDSSGNRIWGTYYGGSQIDWGAALVLDKMGNFYIAGSTASDSFIATPGTSEPVYIGGQWDAFLAKFNVAGTRIWGTYVGGTNMPYFDIEVGSICLDTFGHVYVSGACDDTSNISTPGCWKYVKTEGLNHYDSYLMQFDTSGNKIWGTYYGGHNDDMDCVSACDGAFVYIGGYTFSDTGIASSTGYQPVFAGASDCYLAKFDTAGQRIWGTYYGGPGGESAGGIALDKNNNIYFLGASSSDSMIASSGCYQPTRNGGSDAFLAKFEPVSGNRIWGTYFGGPDNEKVDFSRIVTDSANNIYIVGNTASTSGMATPGSWQTTYGGGSTDGFLAKFNNHGILDWSTYYGGEKDDNALSVAWDGKGIYIVGQTNSATNIATAGSFLSSGGGLTFYFQGFLAKFLDIPVKTNNSSIIGKNNIIIYPNPNTGNFSACGTFNTTQNSTISIEIMDINGTSVIKKQSHIIDGKLKENFTLPLSLSTGVYFINIKGEGIIESIKFIKE